MDATAIPLPTDETTPPVIKMNFGTHASSVVSSQ
jgi:hypothetical protein